MDAYRGSRELHNVSSQWRKKKATDLVAKLSVILLLLYHTYSRGCFTHLGSFGGARLTLHIVPLCIHAPPIIRSAGCSAFTTYQMITEDGVKLCAIGILFMQIKQKSSILKNVVLLEPSTKVYHLHVGYHHLLPPLVSEMDPFESTIQW